VQEAIETHASEVRDAVVRCHDLFDQLGDVPDHALAEAAALGGHDLSGTVEDEPPRCDRDTTVRVARCTKHRSRLDRAAWLCARTTRCRCTDVENAVAIPSVTCRPSPAAPNALTLNTGVPFGEPSLYQAFSWLVSEEVFRYTRQIESPRATKANAATADSWSTPVMPSPDPAAIVTSLRVESILVTVIELPVTGAAATSKSLRLRSHQSSRYSRRSVMR
jgi:hypothetical protein